MKPFVSPMKPFVSPMKPFVSRRYNNVTIFYMNVIIVMYRSNTGKVNINTKSIVVKQRRIKRKHQKKILCYYKK